MSHEVVSPHSIPPWNHSNQRNYISTFLLEKTWEITIHVMYPRVVCQKIVERVHQMLGKLIRSFELQDNPYLDLDDPWLGILAAASFAMHSMHHNTLCTMPGQLIIGRDMILNTQYLADWTVINAHKQQLIHKNNIIENSKCITHQYKVGDMVMLENHHANKYEQPCKGPYLLMLVNTNGTVYLKIGAVMDTVNIRNIHAYKRHCPALIMGASAVCTIA